MRIALYLIVGISIIGLVVDMGVRSIGKAVATTSLARQAAPVRHYFPPQP